MTTGKTYNHDFQLIFQMGGSSDPEGQDFSAQQMYDAIVTRAKRLLDNDEILEAVGFPHYSMREEQIVIAKTEASVVTISDKDVSLINSVGELEGWCLSLNSGGEWDGKYVIETDDDMDNFKSDYEAEAFVRHMSRNGSEVHKRAIAANGIAEPE
jgi:hypothetical protein